ncbi:hypothetical protein PtA15_16A228 [Puccinia triticina]|uniref:Uncharacterized protein n=1 Tax=Puccinia triticina TaxID=208348 RepID=A0ABY7DBJ3_9BASI|nr:uncharacterized protein PtA15_16A228 [Puccinia triticina]WAQ92322.1 hypothetical protein PtA15_16A228 [Puccinia triticina]WAR64055.1 hypothetical protein PtB15_16B214 [Puccinia triticina]
MSYNLNTPSGTYNNINYDQSHGYGQSPSHSSGYQSSPHQSTHSGFPTGFHPHLQHQSPLHSRSHHPPTSGSQQSLLYARRQQGPQLNCMDPNFTPHIPQLSELFDQLASPSEFHSSNYAHQRHDHLPHYNSSPLNPSDARTPSTYYSPSVRLSPTPHIASPLSSQVNIAKPRAKRAPRVASSSTSSTPSLTTHPALPAHSTTRQDQPASTAPLASLNQTRSRKRKKIQESNQPAPQPCSHEELMNLTEAQLAIDAKKYSKKAMSDADRAFFAEFYHKQRKELCVQAIERGVSLPMVDAYLGKQMPVKKPNRFNHFMRTKRARAVFRGRCEEQEQYEGCVTIVEQANPEAQAAYQNGVPDDDYKTDDDETPVNDGIRKSMSFKRASEQVPSFLDD